MSRSSSVEGRLLHTAGPWSAEASAGEVSFRRSEVPRAAAVRRVLLVVVETAAAAGTAEKYLEELS